MKNKALKPIALLIIFALTACAALFCACLENEQSSVPPDGLSEVHIHTFGEWEETPATCTEDGKRERACTVCGKTQTMVIKAPGHEWQEVYIKNATCTEDGKRITECSVCKQREEEVLGKTGHEWGQVELIYDSTCEKEGLRSAVCLLCGAHENEQTIPKKDHVFGEWQTVDLPDCVNPGENSRSCDVCGFTEKIEVKALGHNFEVNFTVDIPPTAEREGQKSRHCSRAGCNARSEITPVEKLKAETVFTVSLRTSTGGDLPDFLPKVDFCDENGETVASENAKTVSVNLPTKDYYVKVSDLPAGYSLPKTEYKISPENPEIEIRLCAALIKEKAPATLRYRVGSLLYDMEVKVIGLTPEEDRTATLGELFSGYKAVILNMYFRNCPACVQEMPAFCQAYRATAPSGRTYGEEVACVMLDQYENTDTIRQFKKQTNYYLPSYAGERDIPMTMITEPWLRAYFTREIATAFPTSVLIDCEGVIVETHVGGMSFNGFTSMMRRGIERYEAIRSWRISEGLESGSPAANAAIGCCGSAICADVPKRRKY